MGIWRIASNKPGNLFCLVYRRVEAAGECPVAVAGPCLQQTVNSVSVPKIFINDEQC
jgi:hypothetical protein